MANVVVVGAQWGDEGKGKIVDWLSEQADVVVRFQGGHNAGHTLVIGDKVYKLSLLPSGVVRPNKLSVIGNGVVLDPHALAAEVERLTEQGVAISRDNLRVAENATLILSIHRELDALRESGSAGTKIGTTKRGIGPAYEDKAGRRAIRLMDLADSRPCRRRSTGCSPITTPCAAASASRSSSPRRSTRNCPPSRPRCCPTWTRSGGSSTSERRAGRRILFEGAQGALLDVDHGTYPFVTSSNTVAGQAATGSGLGPGRRRLRARHRQGLHDPRGRGAVPDRAVRRDRRTDRPEGPGIRRGDRTQAPLRLVRRDPRAPDRRGPRASTASR